MYESPVQIFVIFYASQHYDSIIETFPFGVSEDKNSQAPFLAGGLKNTRTLHENATLHHVAPNMILIYL